MMAALYLMMLCGLTCTCPNGANGAMDVIAFGVAAVSWGYNKVKCAVTECCYNDNWIRLNASGLQNDFKDQVFGQHLATEIVVKVLKGHFKSTPKKALVLSFEGGTGSGKNFISDIVANNLYSKGLESQYVHKYIATLDAPHRDQVEFYKTELQNRLIAAGRKCGQSLFIFDEMDKMPPGLIDVIYPFVDHHTEVMGVDFRKSIFIFLSNSGAQRISSYMLKQWKMGKRREDVTVKDLDIYLSRDAYNEKGGALWHSKLIHNHLIDYFVPFLPMEKEHIKQCTVAEMQSRGVFVDEKVVTAVADAHVYWPSKEQLYATSGCKKVRSKLDVFSAP
jgi:ATP-dependent Clp protease ATP-binding subunit ClpA